MADTPDNRDDQRDMHGEIEQLRNEVDRLRSRDVAQQLKLSEAKYRALIEGSSDFIYVLDKEGYFTFANQEVENLLGYTPDEILGKHYSAILLVEDLASLKYAFAERRTGERATHQLEIRLRSRSGVTGDVDMDIRHCSLSASGIYQDEAYWGTHGVARDITERKYQATKQLALQQLHRSIWTMTRADDIHQVFIAIRDCLHAMKVPYGEFGVYVLDLGEPPIVHFYGTYDSAEITKKGQWMVTDAESFAGRTMGVWQSGEMMHSRVLENDTTHHYRDRLAEFFGDINSIVDIPFSHGVLTVTTKDGTQFSSRNISFVRELAEALSDGFRRMEDLQDLKLSEQRYRTLVETPNLVVMLIDTEGNFLYTSPQIETWLGYAPADFYADASLMMRLVHPADQDALGSFTTTTNGMPVLRDLEYRWSSTDGQYHWASGWLFPVYETEGDAQVQRASMVQVVVQDTTESKQTENQIKTSLEEKEVLLKEIHHRVKNNLQIISSLLDLQSSNLDEVARRIFADSQNRINSMALIHEELYHSTDLAHVDFETYAGNLAETLIGTYGAASVGLELVVDALPLTLDKAIPMGLIINELVSNSLKHAFPEGATGRIVISLKADDEETFVLVIGDDGIGLPADIEPQNPSSLGLRLVYTLAQQLRGRVDLSRENGTSFTIVRDSS